MERFYKLINCSRLSRFVIPTLLLIIILAVYFKFFLLGKIPFPGDLLITSYSPWLDYYHFPTQNPLISDVFSQLYPWKYLSIDSFKLSQWPLWNPYSFTGTPLLANYQSAPLYPLNILLLLPKSFGWGLYIFSQTLIAAFSMYILLSVWIKSKTARLTGAVIFSLSGLMATWVELGTFAHAASWIPLAIFSVEGFIHKNKTRYLILLALSLSFTALAGNAQITTYSYLIVGLFSLMQVIGNRKRITLPSCLLLLLVYLLSIGLTSIQLIPSFDLMQKSIRLSDNFTGVTHGLLPFGDLLKLFIADFFGNPVTRNYWGGLNYFESSGFVGTVTLPLLIFVIFYVQKNRISRFFLILFFVSLILVIDNPLSHWLYNIKIPLLTSSSASRALFLTTFSLSILSAFGLNELILKPNKTGKLLKSIFYSLIIFIGIYLGLFISNKIVNDFISTTPKIFLSDLHEKIYLEDAPQFLINYAVSLRNTHVPMIILSSLFFITLILYIIPFKIISQKKHILIIIILISLLTLDLSRYFLKFNPFVQNNLIFPVVPAIEFLQQNSGFYRVGREHAETLPPNTWMAYSLSSLEGYDPLYFSEYGKYINFLNGGDLRSGTSSRYAELSNTYVSPYIDITSTKYFIGIGRDHEGRIPGNFVNYKFEESDYKRVFDDKSAVIFENPHALPRAYFAPTIERVTLDQAKQIIMTDKQYDPRTKVFLNSELNISTVDGKGFAQIESYTPNRVFIKTITEKDQVLILTDQFDEGWTATIDGKQTPISRANLIFRAVKITSGEHQVIFTYWPKSFDLGLKISLISIGLLLVLLSISIKKKAL